MSLRAHQFLKTQFTAKAQRAQRFYSINTDVLLCALCAFAVRIRFWEINQELL
jgi:hypothetical protein